MNKDNNLIVRFDSVDKQAFAEIMMDEGYTMSAAINLFIKQVIKDGGLRMDFVKDVLEDYARETYTNRGSTRSAREFLKEF